MSMSPELQALLAALPDTFAQWLVTPEVGVLNVRAFAMAASTEEKFDTDLIDLIDACGIRLNICQKVKSKRAWLAAREDFNSGGASVLARLPDASMLGDDRVGAPPLTAEGATQSTAEAEHLWEASPFVTTLLPQNARAAATMPSCTTLRDLLDAAHSCPYLRTASSVETSMCCWVAPTRRSCP